MAFIWLLGIIFSWPGLFSIKLDQSFDGSFACSSKWNEEESNNFFVKEFMFLFFIPFTIIYLSSAKLILFLRNSNENLNSKYTQTSISVESRAQENVKKVIKQKNNVQKKVVKMLLAIAVLFVIQWTPIWIFEFFVIKESEYHQFITILATLFSHSNSISNPIIYVILSHKFPFIDYLRRCFKTKKDLIVV